jgi:hypothetical protein
MDRRRFYCQESGAIIMKETYLHQNRGIKGKNMKTYNTFNDGQDSTQTRFSLLPTLGIFLGTLTSLIAWTPSSFAAKFANQFVEFEMPPQWQCLLEGAEWVCQNTQEDKKRDAIIVLAAKLKGDQDSLDQYQTYLSGVKNFTSVQGKPLKSEPKFSKMKTINGHPWVDSLHFESEIPGFYTHYYATIKEDIGVLVTYSVNKAKYSDYQSVFENMENTLRVFRKAGGLNTGSASGNLFSNTQIPTNISAESVFGTKIDGGADKPKKQNGGDDMTLYLIVGALAIGGFIWFKKKRGG